MIESLPEAGIESPKARRRVTGLAVASLTIIGTYLLMNVNFNPSNLATQITDLTKASQPVDGVQELDQGTVDFAYKTSSLELTPDCLPVHVGETKSVGVLYLMCSDEALAREGEPTIAAEGFEVPEGIARRYNFWRRIYSLWSKEQYVLHVSRYPEVVMEIYDGSDLDPELKPRARERKVKQASKNRRALYKRLLLAMHKHRMSPHRFTPAMKRIARNMRHIKDDRKYAVAAHALRLQRGQREFIESGLTTASKYIPHIRREFAAQGIPLNLSYLPFVESSFNLKAVSKVGASGVWQIMPATGKQYLKMLPGIDERNDPIKGARAAGRLLRLNYRLTGSWPLAITAYNHGVGGIRRAIKTVGSEDIVDLINKYEGPAFGFASKNFYASFLGMLATLENRDRLFPNVETVEPLAFKEVKVRKPTALKSLAKDHGATLKEISALNPDLHWRFIYRGGVCPRGYVLKVPAPADTLKAE